MKKRLFALLLAVVLLFAAMPGVSAANYDRTIGAFNYLRDLAKTGTPKMDWYELVINLAPQTKFTLTFNETDNGLGLVIEETSLVDVRYHRIYTLSLNHGYWNYERDSVQGYYLCEGSDMPSGWIGDYIFLHSDFTGTTGLPFDLGYAGDPELKQQAMMEAALGVSDILSITDGLLKQGGYSVKDLGFISYRGHLTHSYGRNLETAAPNCTVSGFERGTCYVCKAKLDKVIPALGHTWELTQAPAEGVHAMGEYACDRCGETKQAPLCAGEVFPDAPKEGNWAHESVDWAWIAGITNGTSATTFSPAQSCTRAQVVTFLWRAKGSPTPEGTDCAFTDVTPGTYYYEAMLWAVENGITNGTSAATFSPDRPCSRGEVVTFLWRANGEPMPSAETMEIAFTDTDENAFYYPAMLWAVEHGITTGITATSFAPALTCSRDQIITFLYRDLAQQPPLD